MDCPDTSIVTYIAVGIRRCAFTLGRWRKLICQIELDPLKKKEVEADQIFEKRVPARGLEAAYDDDEPEYTTRYAHRSKS